MSYAYSNGGRLSSLTDWSSRTSTYTYTAAGLAKTLGVPGGMTTTYDYDRAQRLTSLSNKVGATTITSHAYTLDPEGNRTALVEFLSGVTAPGQTESFGFSYDGLNRLSAVTTTNPETFTLDAASNISARTGPPATYTIDGENRPTSDGTQTYAWSSADRLTARGADSFGYDPLDRLTSSTVGGTALTYAYSGDGLLQSLTQGAATASFLWDLGTAPQRLLQVGDDRLIYGLGPLYAISSDGTTLTFARDAQKSIRAELNSAGAVTASFRYRAYGQIAQSSGSGPTFLGYAGQLTEVSGLLYMRARWYDPSSGRFLSRDPLAGDTQDPTALNVYAYARANPTLLTDPSGMCVPVCLAAALPFIGGASALEAISFAAVLAAGAFAAGSLLLFASRSSAADSSASAAGDVATPPNPNWDDDRTSLDVPQATDRKLQNVINDLYKGVRNPNRVGRGTTADAIRNELATGQPTSGRYHFTKGEQAMRRLEKWLSKNPDSTPEDIHLAQSELQNLIRALAGQ